MDQARKEALVLTIENEALRAYERESFDKQLARDATDALEIEDLAPFRAACRALLATLEAAEANIR